MVTLQEIADNHSGSYAQTTYNDYARKGSLQIRKVRIVNSQKKKAQGPNIGQVVCQNSSFHQWTLALLMHSRKSTKNVVAWHFLQLSTEWYCWFKSKERLSC